MVGHTEVQLFMSPTYIVWSTGAYIENYLGEHEVPELEHDLLSVPAQQELHLLLPLLLPPQAGGHRGGQEQDQVEKIIESSPSYLL